MSVRINADADKASRSTNLPPTNNITVFMFVKLVSDTNNFATFYSQDNGSDFQVLETDGDGVTLNIFDGSGNSVAGAAMTVGDWYAIGFSSNGTNLRLYMKNVTTGAASQWFTGTARSGAATVSNLYIGGSSFNEVPNADFRAPRIWRTALSTQAAFDAEANSFSPVEASNIDSWFTFADNSELAMEDDQSVNGRDLNRGAGSWTTEDDPPISPTGTIAVTLADVTCVAVGSVPAVEVPASWFDPDLVEGGMFDEEVPAQGLFEAEFAEAAPTSVTGTANATLGDVTSAANGWVLVTGTGARTLGDVTSSAAGAHGVSGSSASTLAGVTSNSAGAHGVAGAAASTLGDLTSSAAGAVGAAGAVARTLADVTSSSSGAHGVAGSSAVTLAGVTSSSSGTVGNDAVTGTSSATLADVTQSATGAHGVSGAAAAVLAGVVCVGAGSQVVGSSAVVLEGMTCASLGTVPEPVTQTMLPVAFRGAPGRRPPPFSPRRRR